jgi:hypothetical protein
MIYYGECISDEEMMYEYNFDKLREELSKTIIPIQPYINGKDKYEQ